MFKAFIINPKNNINQKKKTFKEISYEWDQLERNLSDNNFWYFISNQHRNGGTGIDYLLDIYCQQLVSKLQNNKFSENDSLELQDVYFDDRNEVFSALMVIQRRKHGLLDIQIGLASSYDNPNYF